MLECPCRRFCNDRRQSGRPSLGYEDAVHARRFSGTNDGAKIVRILYPVENDEEWRFTLEAGRFKNVPCAAVRFRRDNGNDALVIAAWDQTVEGGRWLNMDGNAPGFGLLDKLGELAVGPLDKKPLERPDAGAQRFANGMQTVQQLRPVIVSSGWCRQVCPR
jgi:hypothetical protein